MLRRSVELGINLIDTAEVVRPVGQRGAHRRSALPVSRRAGDRDEGRLRQVRPGCSGSRTAGPSASAKRSKAACGGCRLDRIDLYQLHRIDPAVPEDEQFAFLQSSQREGLIRHIGLSEVDVDQIERARRFFPVVSVQNRYNLADREWETLSTTAIVSGSRSSRGIRCRSAKSVHAGGAVTRIAQNHGATPSQVALAWLLQRSPVMLPIPGTSRRAHLDENMEAAGLRLSDEEFERSTLVDR